MKTVKVYQYDAFSELPNKGNPAGVVLDGDDLTDSEMKEIARKAEFNETAFPLKSEVADLKIRFFTPGHETDLCGHATMATLFALRTRGLLADQPDITIETKAGILPIKLHSTVDGRLQITMKQASPQFKKFTGSKKDLAASIGLELEDIDDGLPILYGSTGIWTLLLPIKTLAAFKNMKPDNEKFPSVLKEIPTASIHPFCMETEDAEADMHGRHFSSPYSGTIEDAVTGTASGVMGAYYANYIDRRFKSPLHLIVEQGHEIRKDGRVMVRVSGDADECEIEITGTAVFVKEVDVLLGD